MQEQQIAPQLFLLIFAAGWVSICALLSAIGGWMRLGELYRQITAIEGRRYSFVSGSIGWRWFPVNYGGCLFVTVGEIGFGLRIFFPFRVLHRPIMISWSSVQTVEVRRYLFWIKRATIRVEGFNGRITIIGKAGEEIGRMFQLKRGEPSLPNQAFKPTLPKSRQRGLT